jgi:hypothetical protein
MYDIDFKRYKRLFTFGCSFTNYKWPTWADVISAEMPQAIHYNFGLSGGGNLFISSQVSEINEKLKFDQDDLIMIMWTTVCREDRWVGKRNGWMMVGNIFTQQEYDDAFVEKFADPKGYLIRDLSLINLVDRFLKTVPSTVITMPSTPFDYQQDEEDKDIKSILFTYRHLIDSMPPSLFSLEMKDTWENGHEYYYPAHNGYFKDYHPDPLRYYNYLKKIGINLTNASYEYAVRSLAELRDTKTEQDIIDKFQIHTRNHHVHQTRF